MADWEDDEGTPSIVGVPGSGSNVCHARADDVLFAELHGSSLNLRAEALLKFITHDPLRLLYLLHHAGYITAFFKWTGIILPGILLCLLCLISLRTVVRIQSSVKGRHAALSREVDLLSASLQELLKAASVETPPSEFQVGQKVLVRDSAMPDDSEATPEDPEDEGWEPGVVTEINLSTGRPLVTKDGWDEAYEWDAVKLDDRSEGESVGDASANCCSDC